MKKLNYLMMIMVFTLACEDRESDIVPQGTNPKIPNPAGSYFESSVEFQSAFIAPIEFEPERILSVRYIGHGSSNMLENEKFEATHEERLLDQHVVANVEFGQFKLSGEGTNDTIYGSYDGLESSWTLEIQGGSGRFASARGFLYLHIVDNVSTNIPLAKITGWVTTIPS